MTDQRLGRGLPEDEDRLPWLEPVEEEAEAPAGPSMVKMIGLVVLGLVLLGAIVGGYNWWSERGATDGDGELIAAPPGPYKVRPPERGGMNVEGEGDTAFAASEGAEPSGRIDMSAVTEAPMVAERSEEGPPPREVAPEGPAGAAPPVPVKRPVLTGSVIQLGAFSSEAGATRAWKTLAGRFRYLEPLNHSILPFKSGERTLYRLRASGPGATDICRRLNVAGESCVTLG